ncbi:probable LRR receptor-like serine/threonine-protein kinase At1g56130 [Phragmites australis]|uniref:probable LRR receptor-like serine/threonine-protein kinase At1g56130 n=1 Tax=Phragmites australis TaxID=29695 RepID=UPI002D771AA7|nr:probable LRR receptor-like serine/threonine-protein kinase At1g56130 [Phragmites australis]
MTLVALFLLVLLTLAAGQPSLPVPPSQQKPTNTDAEALGAVFRLWGLTINASEGACPSHAWHGKPGEKASVNCSCSAECRVTHLNVTGFRNITVIPPELFNLTELVSLDLSNNNLSGPIPPEVANLSKLETWHFNNNQLSGSFPSQSSSLRNLQSLWMFDNYIEGPVPQFIENLTNLIDLRMYGMKLQGPIPQNFSNLTNLEILMLGDLEGGRSSFNFIANGSNLSTLSLRKCGISDQLSSTLPNLPKLKYLDLRLNNLPGPIQPLSNYTNKTYLYLGGNNFNGPLPPEFVQSSLALDVSYNLFLNGTLPGPKKSINYINTSIDANSTIGSENLTLLNCLRTKECNRNNYTNHVTSFAINCGGKLHHSDPLRTVFDEDSTNLGAAGFHVNTVSQWIVSHVGSDPFSESPGIVNTSSNPIANLSELYQTARTSTSALWYYLVGLANGKYIVQLFFAEIVIVDGPGRRLFNIDIQGQNIKKDFDITNEAGGSRIPMNITHEAIADNSTLEIHLYWSGRGTCCIPYDGAYGPLVSAIKVFPYQELNIPPPQAPPHSTRQDEKRQGVVAGIAALCIAAAVISSSIIYLWWKWVSLVKRPMA